MSDLLAHLAELDERRLYLDLGFTSLFAYCTEALGFCKSSAGRRIAVARTCRKYPEAFARVARGELQLSVLSLLGPHLNAENAAELFEACSHQSCERVEELLAARFPKPDVRDLIRRMPARSEARTPHGGSALDAARSANTVGTSNRPAVHEEVRAAAATAPAWESAEAAAPAKAQESVAARKPAEVREPAEPRPTRPVIGPQRKLEPLSVDRFGVHFTADAEFRALLEEVRVLASHREPSSDLLSVMKRGLEAYRRELQKERFGVGRKLRRVRSGHAKRAEGSEGSEPARRSRHVPAAVARAVYLRDGGCCTFRADDGRQCGARRFLELDHVTPWAAGGESTLENLRLRCRAHNQHAARSYFGAELVRVTIASRRRRQGARSD